MSGISIDGIAILGIEVFWKKLVNVDFILLFVYDLVFDVFPDPAPDLLIDLVLGNFLEVLLYSHKRSYF